MKRLVFALLCAAALSACSTPAAYGPATGPRANGYSVQRIENDRFRVSFRGAGPAAKINDFALLRAADLTLDQGYDWFRVVTRNEEVAGSGGPRVNLGTGGFNYGRRSGVGVGLSTGFDLGPGPMRTVTLEVKLGAGATPNDRDAYDARSVGRLIRERLGPGR